MLQVQSKRQVDQDNIIGRVSLRRALKKSLEGQSTLEFFKLQADFVKWVVEKADFSSLTNKDVLVGILECIQHSDQGAKSKDELTLCFSVLAEQVSLQYPKHMRSDFWKELSAKITL